MCDELLNETLFFGIDHAREVVADWIRVYKMSVHTRRSATSPPAFAAQLTAMGDRLRAPEPLRDRHCSVGATAPSSNADSGFSRVTSGVTALSAKLYAVKKSARCVRSWSWVS